MRRPGVNVAFTCEAEPRRLFEAHPDFPDDQVPLQENLDRLNAGYLTCNGDYLPYKMIAEALDSVRLSLNKMTNVSVPARPARIGYRIRFLQVIMQTVLGGYDCSKIPQLVGGPVNYLGIGQDGYFEGIADSV